MSTHVKIFVEGVTDELFLRQYFKHISINWENIQFILLNGKDDSKFKASDFFPREETAKKNLIIIDADNDDLADRRKHINNLLSNFEETAIADLFFLPNDIGSGNLEELQKSIVHEKYASFFECYDTLNNCIPTPYKLNLKDAVYAYQSTLLDEKESKKRVDYIGASPKHLIGDKFWNLDHKALNPLKEFLLKHLSA
jgi:hypothetical protein